MTRKVLALLLSVLMVITMIPFTVFAEETGETVEPVAPVEVKFVYGDKSFTQSVTVGETVTMPALPADAVIPEGKIMAGWLANGTRHYVGATHVLAEGVVEFTAEFVDRGSVVFNDPKGQYPTGTSAISAFENPWSSTGNYVIKGVEYAATTFDGYSVKSFKKAADAEKMQAIRSSDNDEMKDYPLNLFNYDTLKDSKGVAVSAYDARYIVVEYYYDITNRDTTDAYGTDLSGKKMHFSNYDMYINGTKTKGDAANAVNARKGIVANSWQKAVFPLVENAKNKTYFDAACAGSHKIGQYALYPFGTDKGIQFYKGDVFYIKSIEYYSYDPDVAPAATRAAEVYVGEGEAFHVYNNVKDLDTIKLPTVITPDASVEKVEGEVYLDFSNDADYIAGNKKFTGFVRKNYGTKYASGATFKLNDLDDAIFYADISEKYTISFDANGDASTVNAFKGDSITVPALSADAEIPEGKVFTGWMIGGKIYLPGETYVFDGENTAATACFDSSVKVYYSADGVIDGVNATVYTSISDADAAIAKLGGVGTIAVEGNLEVDGYYDASSKYVEPVYNITSKEITFVGYDENATATFNAKGNVRFTSPERSKVVFDNIKIVRGDGTNDENWIIPVNIDLVFGKGCTFQSGKRTTDSSVLNLYISKGVNNTVTVDGEVLVTVLAPVGGWGTNQVATGDYGMTVDGGTVGSIFLVARNGNGNGSPSIVNGNVNVEVNGGKVNNLYIGSHKADKLNGNAIVTINGGKISSLKFGNDGIYNEIKNAEGVVTREAIKTGYLKNVALVINAKSILEGGYAVPMITKTANQNDVENSVVVVNNVELIASVPYLDVADYNVQVRGGKATPVLNDNGVFFEIVTDDAEKSAVFANGVAVEAVDGLYTLPEGKVTVQFAAPGAILNTVTYADDDESLDAGYFASGDTFYIVDQGLTKENCSLEGYKVGETNYYIGDLFTMPEEAVTFEALWVENPKNVYYVSSEIGSDDYAGVTKTRPFATVSKAYSVLGSKNGMIVIIGTYTNGYIGNIDSNKNFKYAAGQHIAITGKDPYTGEDYAAKVTRPNQHRPAVQQGHIELSYITEIHVANSNNHPFNVQGSAEFTLGTGYEFHANNGANKCGVQVNTVGGNGPTLNIDGQTQFVTFLDSGSRTFSGDITINVGPNATFSNYGVVLGGDGGEVTATVQGKVFVNVNGNKSGKPIALSGFKSTVNTTLNGVQIVLVDTNMTVQQKPFAAGTYTNNGPLYVVTAPAIFEGANVETTEFGKVRVTLPEGMYAIVSSTKTVDGVSVADEIELSETTEITLNEGNTDIVFTNTLNRVTVKYENGTEEEYYASTPYTLPEGEDVDGKKFYGWIIDGEFMPAGAIITLPEEEGAVVNVVAKYYDNEDTIYLSTLAGDDANDGFTAETALKSLAEVKERLSVFDTTGAKLVIVDEINAGTFTMPAYAGVLTVEGGKIITNTLFSLAGDIVMQNVEFFVKEDHKHIVCNGYDFTFGEGITIAEGSKPVRFHTGKINADVNADQTIVLKSGTVASLMLGPCYINDGTTKKWTGNINVIIDGAVVEAITHGDGYGTVRGSYTMEGSETIIVKSGALNKIEAGYLAEMTGNITVIDYTDFATGVTNHKGGEGKVQPLPMYIFNMREGNVFTSFENGVLTIEEEANLVGNDTIVAGTEFEISAPGAYDVMNTPIVTSEGAQIRLYVDETTPSALRFVAKAYGVTMDAKADYGMLVYPTELLGEEELTHALVGNKKAKEVMAEKIFAHDGTSFTYTAAVVGIADTAEGYQKKFTVVPFYKDANGQYVYLEAMNYSLYDIASVAKGEDAESEYIKGIIEAVNPSEETPDENETPEAPVE